MIRTTWTASWTHRRAITTGARRDPGRPEAVALDVVHLPADRRAGVQLDVPAVRDQVVAEARAYLDHPILGPRLVEFSEAALGVEGRSAYDIFGSPDDMKLKSCATLFASVTPPDSVFARLLDRYFQGEARRPDASAARYGERSGRSCQRPTRLANLGPQRPVQTS